MEEDSQTKFDNDVRKPMAGVKMALLDSIRSDPNPTRQYFYRRAVEELDVAWLMAREGHHLSRIMPEMAEAAAEKAVAEGTLKFPPKKEEGGAATGAAEKERGL